MNDEKNIAPKGAELKEQELEQAAGGMRYARIYRCMNPACDNNSDVAVSPGFSAPRCSRCGQLMSLVN